MDVDTLVETYVSLRDKKDEVKARHAEELRPYNEGLEKLEALLHRRLHDAGADSIKTGHGTAYLSKWTKALVEDWQAVLDYAVENERLDLFERRVNKTVVEEIGQVPGVRVDTGVRVNVRRK